MWIVYVGQFLVIIGIVLIIGGFQVQLNGKMENKTGHDISGRLMDRFTDEDGNQFYALGYIVKKDTPTR